MRPIKFRAWDKRYKQMVNDVGILNGRAYDIRLMKTRMIPMETTALEAIEKLAQDDIVTMQFTGLVDKNGKEIYEGDIVIEKSYPMYNEGKCNYRCAVIWYEDEASFGLEMYTVSDRVRGCAVPNSLSEYEKIEVIGNIYENPELVKS